MVLDSEAAICEGWCELNGGGLATWMGVFTCIGILIGARDCMLELGLFFEVGKKGSLHRV